MTIFIIAIVGASVGSFLNVITYRWQKSSSLCHLLGLITFGRSRCTSCQIPLSIIDLIPVLSWIMLRGRYRICRIKISSRYLVVEIITAIAFVLLTQHFNTMCHIILFSILSSWFILLAFIDIDSYLLPDVLTLSLLWFTLYLLANKPTIIR